MPNLLEIRSMARSLGVSNFTQLRKTELIRAVQKAEGNSPCFQQITDCAQNDCLFIKDCQPMGAKSV